MRRALAIALGAALLAAACSMKQVCYFVEDGADGGRIERAR